MLSTWLTCPARLKTSVRPRTGSRIASSSSHVDYMHGNKPLDVCEVEAVGAGVRYQGVHDRYPCPEPHQPADKIAADEPVATGNQNGCTVEGLLYRGISSSPWPAWRTTSRHHKRTMSIPTSAMRRGVKNWERPYDRR